MNAIPSLLESAQTATRFDPNARSYEAFSLGTDVRAIGGCTNLLQPLSATTLNDALAETTARWSWDRGQRLGIREIGQKDLLHIYAARRSSQGHHVWRDHMRSTEYKRSLEHICTIDLNVIAGIPVGAVGCEVELHEHRQRQRPDGATFQRNSNREDRGGNAQAIIRPGHTDGD